MKSQKKKKTYPQRTRAAWVQAMHALIQYDHKWLHGTLSNIAKMASHEIAWKIRFLVPVSSNTEWWVQDRLSAKFGPSRRHFSFHTMKPGWPRARDHMGRFWHCTNFTQRVKWTDVVRRECERVFWKVSVRRDSENQSCIYFPTRLRGWAWFFFKESPFTGK